MVTNKRFFRENFILNKSIKVELRVVITALFVPIILCSCLKKTELSDYRVHHSALTRPTSLAKTSSSQAFALSKASKSQPEKAQEAIPPMHQPPSRYGNLANYKVMGKEYKVRSHTKEFKQQGIASWYGPNFHKKRTSSGETYDMYQMTAAHKTLPIPCFVRVKNLENGKVITVKVNDRGPFHNDRIIDLSYAAAKELDMVAKGTAAVEINIIANPMNKASKHLWYIQTGAFSRQDLADKMANKIKVILSSGALVKIIDKNEIHLVNLGPFETKEIVNEVKEKLSSIGINESFTYLN